MGAVRRYEAASADTDSWARCECCNVGEAAEKENNLGVYQLIRSSQLLLPRIVVAHLHALVSRRLPQRSNKTSQQVPRKVLSPAQVP